MTVGWGKSWQGLGNVERLKTDFGLNVGTSCCDVSGGLNLACVFTGVPIGPWSKLAIDNAGELAESVARRLVALNFSSGAKIDVLGGDGRDVGLCNPSPTFWTCSELACGDSSAMS
jgi:hypothetical protein